MAKMRAKLPKMAAPVVLPEPEFLPDTVTAEVATPKSGRYRVRSLQPYNPIKIPMGDGLFIGLWHHFLTCEAPMSAELQRLVDNKAISIEEI